VGDFSSLSLRTSTDGSIPFFAHFILEIISQHLLVLEVNLMKWLVSVSFVFAGFFSAAQNFPVSPNQLNETGFRQGHWTILYDSAWNEVSHPDSAKYYRLIRFDKGKPSGKVRDFFRNGSKQWDGYLTGIGPDVFDGEGNFYYQNGKLQSTRNYSNGKINGLKIDFSLIGVIISKEPYKDDRLEGVAIYYHDNGTPRAEVTYKNNFANGQAIFYHANGKLKSKYSYKNNKADGVREDFDENGLLSTRMLYKDDLREGEYIDFFSDSSIKQKGTYKNDKAEGFWIEYHAPGKLKNKGRFANDLLQGTWSYYHENGNLRKEGVYLDNESEGEWRYFSENGQLESKGTKHKGLSHGVWLKYYPNGILKDSSVYERDTLNGPSIEYFEDGKKKVEGPYKKGNSHGTYTYYYSNGQTETVGGYLNGKRQGLWQYYFENGIKNGTETYNEGLVEGEVISLHPNGTMRFKKLYSHDKKNGPYEEYYEDGRVKELSSYKDHKLNGLRLLYHQNGTLKSRETFVDGISNGETESYYDNGVLEAKGVSRNGQIEGHLVAYYKNGKVLIEKEVHNGKLEGKSIAYDSLGKGSAKGMFVDGKMDGKWVVRDDVKGKNKTVYYRMGFEETPRNVSDSIDELSARNDYQAALDATRWLEKVVKRDAKTPYEKALPYYHYGSVYEDLGNYEASLKAYQKRLALAEKFEKGSESHKVAIHNVAFAYRMLKQYDKALQYFGNAIEQQRLNGLTKNYWAAVHQKAICLYQADRTPEAIELLEREMQQFVKMYADSTPAWVARANVADFYLNQLSNYKRAEELYNPLVKDIHRHKENKNEILYKCYQKLGEINSNLSKPAIAMAFYDSAVSFAEENKLIKYPQYGENLVGLYDQLEGRDTATVSRKKIIAAKLKTIQDSPFEATLLGKIFRKLQLCEYDNGSNEESIKYGRRATTVVKQNTLLYANVLQTMAWAFYYQDNLHYDSAESVFERAIEMRKSIYGENSDMVYGAKLTLGNFYYLISHFQKSERTILEVLPLLKAKNEEAEIARAHRYLGDLYYGQVRYTQALDVYLSARAHYDAHANDYPSEIRALYSSIAWCYLNLSNYEQAVKHADKAYQFALTQTGEKSDAAINRLKDLAEINRIAKVFDEAEKYLHKQAETIKEMYGTETLTYLSVLIKQSELYRDKGEPRKALALIKPLLAQWQEKHLSHTYVTLLKELASVFENLKQVKEEEYYRVEYLKRYKELNNEDFTYALYLGELANFYSRQNKIHEAEQTYTLALSIANATDYATNPMIRTLYTSLGGVKSSLDKNKEAEELFLEAMNITRKDTLNNPVHYELAAEELSDFYIKVGRYNDSEKVTKNILALVERKEGKSFYYYRIQNNLSTVYQNQSRYEEAMKLGDSIVTPVEEEYGVNNWLALSIHNNMGVIALKSRDFSRAKSEFEKCMNGYLSRSNPTQIDLAWIATSASNLASAEVNLGMIKEAEEHLRKCDATRKEFSIAVTTAHVTSTQRSWANIFEAKQEYQKAENTWNQILSKLLDYTNTNFYFMSDEEKAQFWKSQGYTFQQYQSFALRRAKQNSSLLGNMYNVQLATKAILLSSSNKIRKRILSGGDTAMVNTYYRWQHKRDQLAQLYASPSTSKEYLAQVDSIKNNINHIEKELNIAAEDVEKDKGGKLVQWRDVQTMLKSNEAAVEIIRLRYHHRYERDSIVYVALILTAETKTAPMLVILPDGKSLEGRSLRFYKNAIGVQMTDTVSWKAYWQPIQESMKDKTRLYLSLDGVYNSINLNTLRNPEGKFIVDGTNMTLLANTKDLLAVKGKRRISSSSSASLVGFPTYFLGKEKIKTLGNTRDFDMTRISDTDRSGIAELPGTREEIEKVNGILKANRWQVNTLTSEAATETSIKEFWQPRLVHIATHGFFTNEDDNTSGTDPMLRAGLLFTGAANFLQDQVSATTDNGILTAYEAANLNLDNTDLVVLSACETGKGEVQNGEGVYGLQRAFQTAGAQAIIMSLWKVDDTATQELMTSFYQNWMNGSTKAEAFRQAQLQLKNKYSHPYYWGAFVMMGN
jgi:antitoxin component YwqK of YwqJK toxin-antitoxin module/CHAT domain-containing protein